MIDAATQHLLDALLDAWWLGVRLSVAIVTAALVCSCSFLREAAEDEVEKEARTAAPGDANAEEAGPTVAPSVAVSSVRPNRGETGGGTPVEILGLGFDASVRILFGNVVAGADLIQVLSDTALRAISPAAEQAGTVSVRVQKGDETGVLEQAFTYFDAVAIEGVDPSEGPAAGGETVTVFGAGFVEGTRIRLGNHAPVSATLVDSRSVVALLPPLPAGTYAVTVSNLNGAATLPSAFVVFDPVTITRIEPFAGPSSGGNEVVVYGSGLVPGTSLRFGLEPLVATARQDGTRLHARLPLSDPLRALGPVDVHVENAFGDDMLPHGYVFVDGETARPEVLSVFPGAGLVEGGNTVGVAVTGLQTAEASVYFGDATASACAQSGDFAITCEAPAAPPGTVDVRVTTDLTEAVLPGAYTYVDLRIDSAAPSRGAIAGGTVVELRGNGFGLDTEVLFGTRTARDVDVASAGADLLTLRTPPGVTGPASITVRTMGVERTVQGLYAYFDPADVVQWTSGGPIDGTVNVTVIDSTNSGRLAGAMVIVGDRIDLAAPHRHGFTDDRGQITVSGPDIVGPLAVHAGKPGFGAFSFIDIDAENLTLALDPHPSPPLDPLPDCPQGDGTLPPRVRGHIRRVKDTLNTGNDIVVVTSTYIDFSTPLPDPGPFAQVYSQGPYELRARTGDMVLIAMAGSMSRESSFIVHSLGFFPFFFAEPSSAMPCEADTMCPPDEQCLELGDVLLCQRVYENIDIVVDTPLSQPMRIALDDPPWLTPGEPILAQAPSLSRVFVWYDFGYMGLHPMGTVMGDQQSVLYVNMPDRMPEGLLAIPFHVRGGVYYAVNGSASAPYSESRRFGLLDTHEQVLLSPMLRTHDQMLTTPSSSGDAIDVSLVMRPERGETVTPTGNVHFFFDYESTQPCAQAPPISAAVVHWLIVTGGYVSAFTLPLFPESARDATPSAGSYGWQAMSLYAPGVSLNAMSLSALFDWRSESTAMSSIAFP